MSEITNGTPAANIPINQPDIPPPPPGGKMVPFTQREWDALTPKQRWDVTVALRGPDMNHSDTLKWFTTAVIRGKMKGVTRVGGLINTDLNLLVVPVGRDIRLASRPSRPVAHTWPPIKHKHPTEGCEWCEYQAKLIDFYERRPRFDAGHFFTHIIEAGEILGIPSFLVPDALYADAITLHSTNATKMFVNQAEKEGLKDVSTALQAARGQY